MGRFFVAKTRAGPAEAPTTPLTAFVKGDPGPTGDFSTAIYTPNGTGAVERNLAGKLKERASLTDYFQVPDGNYQNALTKAINAVNAGQISGFHIPAGDYAHSAALPTITRNGAWITGDGPRVTRINPTGSFDCLRFVSATPLAAGAAGRISDLHVSGFAIDYGSVVAPTGGVALTLDRLDRSHIDVTINSGFQGLLCRSVINTYIGCENITGAYSWTALASGSYLAKFTYYPGTTELNSEITVGPINWKGSDANLERAIVVEAADGIFFSTGHAGFAFTNQLHVVAQPFAWASIINIDMGRVYLDGNNAGSATGAAVLIERADPAAVAPNIATVNTIDLSATTIANCLGKGVVSTLVGAKNILINGTTMLNIGKGFVDLTSANGYSVSNATMQNGNTSNLATAAVKLTSCSKGTHSGNRVINSANTFPKGFDLTSVLEGTFTGNLTEATTDYSVNTGNDRIAFSGNRKVGSSPAATSAAASLTLPMGFDFVTVPGNAAMTGINAPNVEDYKVTLYFSGTASFSGSAGNIRLAGGTAFKAVVGSSISFVCKGGLWMETARTLSPQNQEINIPVTDPTAYTDIHPILTQYMTDYPGRVLVLPAGDFVLSAPINFTAQNVGLRGQGKVQTRIAYTGTLTAGQYAIRVGPAVVTAGELLYGNVLNAFTLRHNGVDTVGTGIKYEQALDCNTQDVIVSNFAIETDIVGGSNLFFTRFQVYYGSAGTGTVAGSRHMRVRAGYSGAGVAAAQPAHGIFMSDCSLTAASPGTPRVETGVELLSIDGFYMGNNNYVGQAANLVDIKLENGNAYIANIQCPGIFLDGNNKQSTNGLRILNNPAATGPAIAKVNFKGANVSGFAGNGFTFQTAQAYAVNLTGAIVETCAGIGIDAQAIGSLTINGVSFAHNGTTATATTGSIKFTNACQLATLTGCTFNGRATGSVDIVASTAPVRLQQGFNVTDSGGVIPTVNT